MIYATDKMPLTKTRKSQIAVEYMSLMAIGLVAVIIFAASVSHDVKELKTKKDLILLKDVSYSVQSEINLAAKLKNGYSREFQLPLNLEGKSYSVSIIGNQLIALCDNYEVVLPVADVHGNVTIPNNTITKNNDIVCLNC